MTNTIGHATASDLETLQELNRGYVRAAEHSDVAWYAEHLTEDFLATNPDGSVSDRAAFLARMAKPCPTTELRAIDVNVRILGDVALIHARTTYTLSDGRPASGRYTDVWARRNGRWLCVSAHVTRG